MAELVAPLTNGLIGDEDAALCHHLFNVAVAQAETKIQPYAMADDLSWIAVAVVRIAWVAHADEYFSNSGAMPARLT